MPPMKFPKFCSLQLIIYANVAGVDIMVSPSWFSAGNS